MLPLPYPVPFQWLLAALLALDLLLLASGLALGRPDLRRMGRLPAPVCMALSGLLVVAALAQWRLVAGSGPLAGYGGWVTAGMALGLLGDLIMARLIAVPDRLIFGMLAFGLGHVAYIAAMAGLSAGLGLWKPGLNLPLGALMVLVAVALWYGLVRKPGGSRGLNAAALVYSLLIAAMNALAIALALQQARFAPLAVGALLFLASDLILGSWNIRGRSWKGINDVIWVTYNLGQALIVFSVAAAVNTVLAL